MRKDRDVILIEKFIMQAQTKIMVYAGQVDELKRLMNIEHQKLDGLLKDYREKQEEK